MRSSPSKKRGFTLIEVTLAIVIGIVMIAGATLIYNQAKASAGNSRAQAKVVALQSLIEEYAARNSGIYPMEMAAVQALWARKRPDDWNKSPWGGLIGSRYQPTSAAGFGVISRGGTDGAVTSDWRNNGVDYPSMGCTGCASRPGGETLQGGQGNYPARTSGAGAAGLQPDVAGGLVYDLDPRNVTWQYGMSDGTAAGDVMTNGTVAVRGYAVWVVDTQGRYPCFVTGGKAN